MTRDQALAALKELLPELREKFGVRSLRLFGSMARDQGRDDSDLDLLVSFEEPISSKRYFGTLFALEDRFGCRIDLVTEDALRNEFKPYVERDAIAI